MRRMRGFLLRLGGLFRKGDGERELAAEIESHFQLHIEDNLRAGMTPEEARRRAVLKFGGIESAKEDYRDQHGVPFLDTLAQDLRYAARTLRNNPVFTLVAVATLALGIGVSTAMFSVVQAVLLRPLPYPQSNRLVEITETNPLKGWTHTVCAPANFNDWRKDNTVFSAMSAYAGVDRQGKADIDIFLTGAGEPVRLKALLVTGDLFDLLGVAPMLGRGFTYDETFEGKDRVAILSHGLWQAQFASDPNIIGRGISLNGRTYNVIGVMPASFFFPTREVQVFIPLGVPPKFMLETRRPHWLSVIARLRSGVSIGQARDQMTSIATRLEHTYPDTNTKMGVRLENFRSILAAESRPALLMLLTAVGVLFLIVCSNVANLQLGRGASRVREFSVRQALGAGRGRLIRQLLTEALVLSAIGGALGFALAAAAHATLLRLAPDAIPLFAELRLDAWVVFFNVAVTAGAPLLFGIVPALTASRPEALRDRGETASRANAGARDFLVACEVALSVMLVVGAGLLVRSLIRLESVDPGFRPEHAISFRLVLPQARYPDDAKAARAFDEIETRLRAQPGVAAEGLITSLPLRGYSWTGDATVEGRPAGDYERELRHDSVTPGYFHAVGTPLLRGRQFTAQDTAKSPPVTIVNATLQKTYFRGENVIGRRIKFGRPMDKDPWQTIVGVVADSQQDGLDIRVQPEAYSPMTQNTQNGASIVIRGTGDPDALAGGARQAVRAFDRDLAITDVATLREVIQASVGDQRFRTSLLSGFAGIALLLAALGVYGVLSYSVAQRQREIGVRIALGASAPQLFRMVLGDGLRPVLFGSLIGIAGALAAAGVIRSLLFGIEPLDPPTYLLTLAVLAAAAVGACALPAAKAMRVDPIESLRQQ